MDERDMTLLQDFESGDVSGWFCSEKYDGCRGFWDGRRMWTRGGNVVELPAWFAAELPAGVALDGEIWCGRGQFQAARVATQCGARFFTEATRFMVFDAPSARGRWDARMASAASACDGSGVAVPVPFIVPSSMDEVLAAFDRVKGLGGEGLVVRSPDEQRYRPGRSVTALRIKRRAVFEWTVAA